MRGGGGGQQNPTDQTTNFFWMLCLFVAVVLVVWWLWRIWVVMPIFWIRLIEINIITYVMTFWAKLSGLFHFPSPNLQILKELRTYILNTDPKAVTFDFFSQLNWYVGQWVRYPSMIILIAMAGFIYFRHSSLRFRETHSMESLKKVEAENWPQINPILPLNLLKEDLEKGPWAMCKLPLNFCKENNLLTIKITENKKSWQLLRGPAFRVFSLQLGPLWRNINRLPIHQKALLGIFLACAEKDRDSAKKLLLQVAMSAASNHLDFNGAEELAAKHRDSKILTWLEKRHSYVYTLMASLLEIARSDGVLATAEFLWLKPLDRKLWYILNNVGRQTAFVECAGSYAHWLAEKKVGQALKTPMVKEAVNALEQTISETLYIAEDERWHTTNAA